MGYGVWGMGCEEELLDSPLCRSGGWVNFRIGLGAEGKTM
jgi:hypothetical protein